MFRRVAGTSALLAAAFFAAGCTESSAPAAGKQLPPPLFSYSPNGITLDQKNGSFNDTGTVMIKGFNPRSPQNGDAVIATFYWLGSTNIIDSVADVLTTTPYTFIPGNTYHLVKYVTAGGLSMATYVATNIQGIPDGSNDPNPVYAVGAWLRDSVIGGGVRISAWTGVQDVFEQAIDTAAVRSATGSGTAPTVARAGSIAYNGGALVYAASAVNPPVGVDVDPGFLDLGAGGNTIIKEDAVYAVPQSSGTANPQWTWYFDQQPGGGTWVVTSLTLNVAPPPFAATAATLEGAATTVGYRSLVKPVQAGGVGPFVCEYHWTVTNPAPGATETIVWDGGSQDVTGWDYPDVPTPRSGSVTYTLHVDAPGYTSFVSAPLTITGSSSGQTCLL